MKAALASLCGALRVAASRRCACAPPQPAHCALSLVGEPIMYPRINDLVGELHSRGMSTFLVTNAQFPDAMRRMKPVTQMYVSIDAATKESLKVSDVPASFAPVCDEKRR